MANILEYIDWRGDVPFSVAPFCEVDNLIFSELSFLDLGGIVPENVKDGAILLSDAAKLYFERHPEEPESLGLIVPAEIISLFRKMADTARYRDVRLCAFVNHIDLDAQKQFAALTLLFGKKEAYVAYRGTDDTLVGWKENFNMSLLQAVPSQEEAVSYLNAVAKGLRRHKITVGGHSKGGNLAIFAAVNCDEKVKPRINRVYSNDGPGYRHEVVASDAYRAMEDRIETIVPQSSVVGRLLEHDNRYTVIHSTANGLWQHDGFSWEVMGTSFVREGALSHESEMIDRSLKKWIAEMDEEKREAFVTSLYSFLTSTNAQTLTELTSDRNWLWKLLKSSDAGARKTIFEGLAQLTGEAGRIWVEEILPFFHIRKSGEK